MSNIVFESVTRVFRRDGRDFLTLDGISLEIAEKEFVAVVGPSGCGKTTCMRMVAGLEFPTSGQVKVAGEAVRKPSSERAVVFQQFALFPWKSVWDNIDFGLRVKGLPAQKRREIIEHYIGLMNLKGYESAYPHQLSGGMQQRVAIARAYALDPQVLLMDEPFGALDTFTKASIQQYLLKFWDSLRPTVIFVTHDLEEAVTLADRVVVLSRRPAYIKEIIEVGIDRPRDVYAVKDTPEFLTDYRRTWRALGGEFDH